MGKINFLVICISFLLLASQQVKAQDIETVGTISAVCSFVEGTALEGLMSGASTGKVMSSFDGDGANPSSIDVINNSPNSFSVVVTKPTEFFVKPASYDRTPTFAMNFLLESDNGANNISFPASTTKLLENAGRDTIKIRNNINNQGELFLVGQYAVQNTVSCVAN